ncbi:hypothetical protein J4402_00075 [Candidatus Pacearchaeota archaeon]|nr:hypothetical protein [Candidatus Pacearchaeota archaeon]
MSFPLEKILPISTQDYAGPNVNAKLIYNMVGVHGSSLDNLAEKVPERTEVVTDLRFSVSATTYNRTANFYSGTALIPRER